MGPRIYGSARPALSSVFLRASLQLKAMTGNDDTTLVYFLMSLTSPEEVREYIAEYLGAGPKSSLFADEFIKRRSVLSAAACCAMPLLPQLPITPARVMESALSQPLWRVFAAALLRLPA
jgi:hypothetical protein